MVNDASLGTTLVYSVNTRTKTFALNKLLCV